MADRGAEEVRDAEERANARFWQTVFRVVVAGLLVLWALFPVDSGIRGELHSTMSPMMSMIVRVLDGLLAIVASLSAALSIYVWRLSERIRKNQGVIDQMKGRSKFM